MTVPDCIVIGEAPLTIEDVCQVASGRVRVALSDDEGFCNRIRKGASFLEDLLEEDGRIYGVTTGYGDSCTVDIPDALVEELPLHLTRFHGCGMGAHLTVNMARAVLVTRLVSLASGHSEIGRAHV